MTSGLTSLCRDERCHLPSTFLCFSVFEILFSVAVWAAVSYSLHLTFLMVEFIKSILNFGGWLKYQTLFLLLISVLNWRLTGGENVSYVFKTLFGFRGNLALHYFNTGHLKMLGTVKVWTVNRILAALLIKTAVLPRPCSLLWVNVFYGFFFSFSPVRCMTFHLTICHCNKARTWFPDLVRINCGGTDTFFLFIWCGLLSSVHWKKTSKPHPQFGPCNENDIGCD